jgi:Fur family ferric uptake transcriptional regulator
MIRTRGYARSRVAKTGMTLAPGTPTAGAPDLAAAIAALRAHGLRVSAARRLLLAALFAADRPVTAEELAGGIGGRLPDSDLASIYRNLERLEEIGLVRHVHLGHGPGLYAPSGRTEAEFLLCSECRAFRAMEPDEAERVREAVAHITGHEPRFSHFPLVGRCEDCRD